MLPRLELDQILELRWGAAFPGRVELLSYERCVIRAALGLQRLLQPKQRARIPWGALQIIAKDLLRAGLVSIHEQGGAQRFAHWIKPVLGLVVFQAVLDGYRFPQLADRIVILFFRQRN